MLSLVDFILAFFCILICWGIRRIKDFQEQGEIKNRHEVPFGYKGIPGVGFLPNFRGPSCRRKLISVKENYGRICKVRMGSFDCVWLNDYHLIKEAWSNGLFCGRPNIEGISVRTKGFRGGIIFNDGKSFTEQRRFLLHTLKTIGIGKQLLEQIILEEVQDVTRELSTLSGIPRPTKHLFNIPAFNIIWRMITGGSRFQHNDPAMSELMEILIRNMELSDGACVAFFIPWISKHFPNLIGWEKYINDANFIFNFWKHVAEITLKINKTQSNSLAKEMEFEKNSFISSYCEKIEICTDPLSSFFGRNGVLSFATVLQDLFIAGSETTATTLQWICLYLAAFPACQQKAYMEIKYVLGKDSWRCQVQLDDRDRMPYTEAFIKESLRYSTLAPLGMMHCTVQDVEFHGYHIPKDTIVQMNACAVHFDKQYWENPEQFSPERFLIRGTGKPIKGEIPGFLPFSLGKRMCPGTEIARNTLFLATVSILQKFEISTESKYDNITLELNPKVGVSAVPYPHNLIFIERKLSV